MSSELSKEVRNLLGKLEVGEETREEVMKGVDKQLAENPECPFVETIVMVLESAMFLDEEEKKEAIQSIGRRLEESAKTREMLRRPEEESNSF